VARLKRDDGVEIHWEERGEGPLVVLCPHFYAFPEVYENLVAELAEDHRVITYDPRGCGSSTRRGPYDVATDAADLGALIAEAGESAVAVCFGDAAFRATRLATEEPGLVSAIVVTGSNPLIPASAIPATSEALAGSSAVMSALTQMLENDFRGAIRTLVTSTNPQMGEDEIRERVQRTAEYSPPEAMGERFRIFYEDHEDRATGRELGDRLWILCFPTPWFPSDTLERAREALPEAHVEAIEEGPISRPDIVAEAVRKVTAPLRVG
jgi:pimeloyl-ACP methyl ester carboxylesterase